MTSVESTSSRAQENSARPNMSWRVIDIVTAAVLGVAVGLVFVVWNVVGGAGYTALDAFTPGFGGLIAGVWFLGGPLGALIIRKPGAAIFVELIAASASAAVGNQWGISTLYSGLAQGLGAELIFLLVLYRRYNLTLATLSGLLAGVGAWTLEFFTGNIAKSFEYNVIYLIANAISGAVLAGLLAWVLTSALAKTGALDRFAAGRSRNREI